MLKTVIIIPARYEASRFPGKCLEKIHGHSMIQHVYKRASLVSNVDEVIVATDHTGIKNEIEDIGGRVEMTSKAHDCGTSRIAEVAQDLDFDIVINLQGDEPLIDSRAIESFVESISDDFVGIATLRKIINDKKEIWNSNVVKVVVDLNRHALYFSRSPIPFSKKLSDLIAYKHVGIYGFKMETLLEIVKLPKGKLESQEQLEQLRWLENGYSVKVFDTEYESISVDTPDDLERVKAYFKSDL